MNLDTIRIMAEIEKLFNDSVKLHAETCKLSSENAKFQAEQAKLQAEQAKLIGETKFYPYIVAATVGGALVGVTIALSRLLS